MCDQIMQRLHGALAGTCRPWGKEVCCLLARAPDVAVPSRADQCVVMLSQDSFYRNLGPEELQDVKSELGA